MTSASDRPSPRRRWRTAVGLSVLLGLLLLPLSGSVFDASAEEMTNPRADYWRQVREGVAGYSAVKGQETTVLIQGSGEVWRQLRNGPIAAYGSGLLAFALLGIGAFYLARGRIKLAQPRTGETVLRWKLAERLLHWYTALLFILLAITGLSLLYGRAALIPLLGHGGFARYAEIAKGLHNYIGPLFMVGLVLMILAWFKDNIPNKLDVEWFKSFGGMVGHRHPSAGRMNAGEKVWFWLLLLGGLAVCLSGLVLDFPNWGQARWMIQLAHLVHVIFGIILITAALGHIYIGTIGTEGALEGMVSGKVDKSWAIQHHDLWYKEIKAAEKDERRTEADEAVQAEKPILR